jgi:hypothetical protein
MTVTEIINNILAGGLLGVIGQGIRIAVGLKKFNEDNAIQVARDEPAEEFSTSRLVISIFIGFVAGALGVLTRQPGDGAEIKLDKEAIITIIAIGYSGADFIEGVFKTYINKFQPTPTSHQTPQGQSTNGPENTEEQPVG